MLATKPQIQLALRLADTLRAAYPHAPEPDALADLLAFAAIDDESPVDADRLQAAVLACEPLARALPAAPIGPATDAYVASARVPGLTYRVTMRGGGAVWCTCEDKRRHPAERCKHMASAEATSAASAGARPCLYPPRVRGARRAAS